MLEKNSFPISYSSVLFPNKINPPYNPEKVTVDNTLYVALRPAKFDGGFYMKPEDVRRISEPLAERFALEHEEHKKLKGDESQKTKFNKEEYLQGLMKKHFLAEHQKRKEGQHEAYVKKAKEQLEVQNLGVAEEAVRRMVTDELTRKTIDHTMSQPPTQQQDGLDVAQLFGNAHARSELNEALTTEPTLNISRLLGGFPDAEISYAPNPRTLEPPAIDPSSTIPTSILTDFAGIRSSSGIAPIRNYEELEAGIRGTLIIPSVDDQARAENFRLRSERLTDFNLQLDQSIQGGKGINFKVDLGHTRALRGLTEGESLHEKIERLKEKGKLEKAEQHYQKSLFKKGIAHLKELKEDLRLDPRYREGYSLSQSKVTAPQIGILRRLEDEYNQADLEGSKYAKGGAYAHNRYRKGQYHTASKEAVANEIGKAVLRGHLPTQALEHLKVGNKTKSKKTVI